MFKIPKWEDAPTASVDFGKISKKKKKEKINKKQTEKTNVSVSKKKNKIVITNNINKSQRDQKENFINKKNYKQKTKINKTDHVNNNNKPGQFVINPLKRKADNTNKDDNIPQPKEKKRKKRKKKTTNDIDDTNLNGTSVKLGKKQKIKNLNPTESKSILTKDLNKKESSDLVNKDKVVSENAKRINSKKEKFRKMLELQSTRSSIDGSSNSNNLRRRMLEKLKAAQFRYLNEKLYTSSGSEAKQLFQSDPDAFQTYHQGYQQQLKKWPVNPLDLIVKRILKMPKSHMVADMGCGEAALSKRVPQTVRSFDLVATTPEVEVCDMALTPLLSESVDVAVYCLALMGTELTRYLAEANRVLKTGGHLLIAEVESRFDKVDVFTEAVQRLGFKLKNLDSSHEVFFFMEFTKIRGAPTKKSKLPAITLKPCLYKRR